MTAPPADRMLVVNADDFGMSEKVNLGIVRAHREGVVTSASVMPGMPAAAQAVELARECPDLDAGLHLTLTAAPPLCNPRRIPTLVGPDGRLPSKGALVASLLLGRVEASHLEAEVRAQIEWCLARGMRLFHMDVHHHLNALPAVMRACLALAGEYGIAAVRVPRERRPLHPRALVLRMAVSASARLNKSGRSGILFPDEFAGIALTGRWGDSAAALRRLLKGLRPGVTELMCHPGYADPGLRGVTRLVAERGEELEVLTSPALREWIREEGISLTNYRRLARRKGACGHE